MVLTKAGSILGPIATVLGYVMDILFRFTSSFGVFNVGLCIILFTIVMKTLMIPLTIKQQKTTKLMSVMNPEIQAIQKKYKGKSDQESMQRQNVEIQAVYEKYGTSMTGGCLPLLIQMPILLALYRVIYNIPAYVPSVRVYFDNVVTPLMGQADYAQKLQEITNIATACGGKLDKFDFTNANRLVDMLYKFSTAQWGELQALFPTISDVIGQNAAVVERMNTFLGLNMAEAPGWVPSFAWIIPVLQHKAHERKSAVHIRRCRESDGPVHEDYDNDNAVILRVHLYHDAGRSWHLLDRDQRCYNYPAAHR